MEMNIHSVDRDFSEALQALKDGDVIGRFASQPFKYLYLVGGSTFTVNRAPLTHILPMDTPVNYQPHIDYMIDGRICGVYTLTNEDVLATDWFIVKRRDFMEKMEKENEGKADNRDLGTDLPTSAF